MRLILCWLLAVVVALPQISLAEGDATSQTTIHFENGDFATGRLVDSEGGDTLAWQVPEFASPFQFVIATVNSVQFPVPAKLNQPVGEYCFELAGGDMLFGSLVSLEEREAIVNIPGIGELHLDRAILRRMYRWQGGTELIYFGPSGLKDWNKAGASKGWREEAGNLVTDQEGAVLRRDFGLPALVRLEFELSWKSKPDFEFALGVSDAKSAQRAFRFEIWENELIVHRETEREADVASLQPVENAPGRVHLQAFLDQKTGRILVFSSSGKPLADLTVATTKAQPLGGLQLTNKTGDVRLERLSIGRWNGDLPRAVDSAKSRIHTTDGSIIYGQLESFDPAAHEFVVKTTEAVQRLPEKQVQDVFYSQENAVAPRALRTVHLNGQRISGNLIKVANNTIWLKCPEIREEIAAPVESLLTLVGLDVKDPKAPESGSPTPIGRLEFEGLALHGSLKESSNAEAGCLIWQPIVSKQPGLLRHGVAARIVYRDPQPKPKPKATATRNGIAVAVINGAVVRQEATKGNTAESRPKSKQKKPILHLRSGDTILCDSASIDENGVNFVSPFTDTTFIRHDQLKVLELLPDTSPVQIARQKKERLLMLPRMQRDNPPTQLVRSVDGDYLRGRLLSMDDQQIQMEIRLENKTLHRDRIARIIWLHADEIDNSAKAKGPSDAQGTRVQAFSENATDDVVGHGVRNALAGKTNVSFEDIPLKDAIKTLGERHKIDIKIDDSEVDLDQSVSMEAEEITLQNALKLLLEPRGLTHVVEGNVLKITTKARSAKTVAPAAGNRLTFVADQVAGSILSGKSELLGACRVDLAKIDRLLIGPAIEQDASTLAFHQWKLKAAAEPLAANDNGDGSGEGMEGQESALVGKMAPDIELDMLDGTKFDLSSHRSKIVVLDFWASWCGPCLQVMPQVDKVAHELADQGVELVAINLEEKEDKIRAALDRLKLKMPVALDRDGRIAEKYGATAIPQTVIIDRTGKVARLFVGGGPRFGDQLKTALEAVLAEKPDENK